MPLSWQIRRLADLGWRLYPSLPNRKAAFKGFVEKATTNVGILASWSDAYHSCNWSVIPSGSGIWALDVDVPSLDHKADGVLGMRELCSRHGALPPGPRGRSGGGGYLLVFRDEGHRICSRPGTPCPGVDPRAGTCSFTVEPSIHRRGGRYRWIIPPWEMKPPAAPEWLIRLVAPPTPSAPPHQSRRLRSDDLASAIFARCLSRLLNARPGERNAVLNAQAFTAGGLIEAGTLEAGLAIRVLYEHARYAGLPDSECRATIRSGLAAGRRRPFIRVTDER
jgi:hypothetical protein